MKFCILEYIDSPKVETEDIFFVSDQDLQKYLSGKRFPIGSALVWIGDLEIPESLELKINELKLVYITEIGFREYITPSNCLYNVKSFYERQRIQKRRDEEAEIKAALEEERKQSALEAAKKKIEDAKQKQQRIQEAERAIMDESATAEEKLEAMAFLHEEKV